MQGRRRVVRRPRRRLIVNCADRGAEIRAGNRRPIDVLALGVGLHGQVGPCTLRVLRIRTQLQDRTGLIEYAASSGDAGAGNSDGEVDRDAAVKKPCLLPYMICTPPASWTACTVRSGMPIATLATDNARNSRGNQREPELHP
jgi:hypothetical protein